MRSLRYRRWATRRFVHNSIFLQIRALAPPPLFLHSIYVLASRLLTLPRFEPKPNQTKPNQTKPKIRGRMDGWMDGWIRIENNIKINAFLERHVPANWRRPRPTPRRRCARAGSRPSTCAASSCSRTTPASTRARRTCCRRLRARISWWARAACSSTARGPSALGAAAAAAAGLCRPSARPSTAFRTSLGSTACCPRASSTTSSPAVRPGGPSAEEPLPRGRAVVWKRRRRGGHT